MEPKTQIIIISSIVIALLIYYYYQNRNNSLVLGGWKQQAESYYALYQSLLKKESKVVGTQTDNLGIDKNIQTLPDPELAQLRKEKEVINNELSLTKQEKEELTTKLNFLNKQFEKLKDDHKKKLENLKKDNQQKEVASKTIITNQTEQLKKAESLITELNQELELRKNWSEDKIPELETELFTPFQASVEELQELISKATIMTKRKDIESKLEELGEFTKKKKKR